MSTLNNADGSLMSGHEALCLSAMALVESLSARLGAVSYLWGGCALDAYEGRILRAHHDIDYMTAGLAGLGPQFAALFREAGWEAAWIPGFMFKARAGGIKLSLPSSALLQGNLGFAERVYGELG